MKALKGIYLVIDPALEEYLLLKKLREALAGGIDILQIWNHWPEGISRAGKLSLVHSIVNLANGYRVPVLINEEWELITGTGLQGVHFDAIPEDWNTIKDKLGPQVWVGLTAGNEPELIEWAVKENIHYLSFCAMFPSPSVDSCEIVKPASVLKAREICDLPLFLSGGIEPAKLPGLAALNFQGVAIISGIMSADSPRERVEEYRQILKQLNKI